MNSVIWRSLFYSMDKWGILESGNNLDISTLEVFQNVNISKKKGFSKQPYEYK